MPHKTTITGASYATTIESLRQGGSSLVEFSFCKTTQAHTHLVLQRLLLKKRASDNLTTHPTVQILHLVTTFSLVRSKNSSGVVIFLMTKK
jgi:hypothetical protein